MRPLLAGILTLLWSPAISIAATAAEKLDLQEVPTINIDPTTDLGSALLTVVNHCGKSSRFSVHSGLVYASTTGIPLRAVKVTLAPEEQQQPTNSELASGDSTTLRIEVSGLTESGSYSIPLFNGSQPIGKVPVIGFSFRVHSDTLANGMAQVTIAPDRSFFTLKNDDPLPYPIEWTLTVAGGSVAGQTMLRPSTSEEVTITNLNCGSKGSGPPLCLLDPSGWTGFTSLLKDSSDEGRLLIAYRSPLGSDRSLQPHTVVPAKVTTHLRPTEETTVISGLILFVILALGALVSVFANLWIPHNLRKNAMCSRLKLLLRSIREISGSIPSQARISAEVDVRQILDRVQNAGWFYSDFETVLLDYEAQVASLEMKVVLLQQADGYQQDLDRLADMDVPPTYITRARLAFEPAMEVFEGGEWGSAQQKLASDLLTEFKRQVDTLASMRNSGTIDTHFTSDALARFTRLKAVFGNPRSGKAADFEKLIPKIFKRLDHDVLGDNLAIQDWVQIDFDLWKLRLIERFVNAYGSAAGASWRKRLEEKAGLSADPPTGSLIYFLQLNTWDALWCSELLCNEIDQGIFPEDICAAIQHDPPQVSIHVRQKEIMTHRRADCELCFANYALNGATARREITPVWTFSEPIVTDGSSEHADNRARLFSRAQRLVHTAISRPRSDSKTERGWLVSCFVPQVSFVRVTVCFENWFGEMKVAGDKAALEKSFPITASDNSLIWARFWLEITRSLVALAIPVVGLLAGAREKLLSMDVGTAFVAVFILGFSADSIKSALLRGTAAAPTSPPVQPAAQSAPLAPQSSPNVGAVLQAKAAATGGK